jgi:hypothetical protein
MWRRMMGSAASGVCENYWMVCKLMCITNIFLNYFIKMVNFLWNFCWLDEESWLLAHQIISYVGFEEITNCLLYVKKLFAFRYVTVKWGLESCFKSEPVLFQCVRDFMSICVVIIGERKCASCTVISRSGECLSLSKVDWCLIFILVAQNLCFYDLEKWY